MVLSTWMLDRFFLNNKIFINNLLKCKICKYLLKRKWRFPAHTTSTSQFIYTHIFDFVYSFGV